VDGEAEHNVAVQRSPRHSHVSIMVNEARARQLEHLVREPRDELGHGARKRDILGQVR
jgi:hypothetical protein